eukprot:5790539-Amphidinium_carterae.1
MGQTKCPMRLQTSSESSDVGSEPATRCAFAQSLEQNLTQASHDPNGEARCRRGSRDPRELAGTRRIRNERTFHQSRENLPEPAERNSLLIP